MMLKVFVAPISRLEPDDEKWREYVTPARWENSRRLKSRMSRACAIGGELLLNHAVKMVLPQQKSPIHYRRDESGKLFLPESGIHFNLSHSGDYVACAVSDVSVGIDIQQAHPIRFSVVEHFFAPEEVRELKKVPQNGQNARILQYWVLKESYVKMTGEGLKSLRGQQCFLQTEPGMIRMYRQGKAAQAAFYLWEEPIAGYSMAVCVAGSPPIFPELNILPENWMK